MNQDGVSGLIVPPADAGALGAALARIGGEESLRSELGEGARVRADSVFDRERMVQSFRDLIENVVGAGGRPSPVASHQSEATE